jgi:hypothetical protein
MIGEASVKGTENLSPADFSALESCASNFHFGVSESVSTKDRELLLQYGFIEPASLPGFWAETNLLRSFIGLPIHH